MSWNVKCAGGGGEWERAKCTNQQPNSGRDCWTMLFFVQIHMHMHSTQHSTHSHIETIIFLINILDEWIWKFVAHHMCFLLQLEVDKMNS